MAEQAKNLKVLIVEDSEDDVCLVMYALRKGGYSPEIRRVDTRDEIIDALQRAYWDIVISDHNIPGLSAGAVLEIVQDFGIDVPFIIVSGDIGEETAVDVMNIGAHDYIMKDKDALIKRVENSARVDKDE